MRLGPFRTPGRDEHGEPAPRATSTEENVLAVLLLVVGAGGVLVGVLSPGRTLEPSLGLLVLVFVAKWRLTERGARRR